MSASTILQANNMLIEVTSHITLHSDSIIPTRGNDFIQYHCCDCSEIISRKLRDVFYNKKYSCWSCVSKTRSQKRINSFEKIQSIIKEGGCVLLPTDDLKSHSKLNILCKCGNTYKQTLSDFRSIARNKRTNQCPSCSRTVVISSHTYTLDIVKQKIKDTGCEYISGEYINYNSKLNIKCGRCNQPFINTWKDFYNNGTYACATCTNNSISEGEISIESFLHEHNIQSCNMIRNDRTLLTGKELDFVILPNKLAIEYNGAYYHTEKFDKHRNYHLSKTKNCIDNDLTLLHIWDYEWTSRNSPKQNIWKSIILNKLNKTPNKIHARKCIVRELSHADSSMFLDSNHLQGKDNSPIRLGLYFNNELVQVMTFSKPRFNKSVQYELVRNATKTFNIVNGGTSKLLTYFTKTYNPTSIVSYADRRYSTGKVYLKIGFSFIRNSPPSYQYVKNKIFNRMGFKKHLLIDKLPIYDPKKSENENMKDNNYYRLWDCGCGVFIWKK